jgi:hypothetical protein
VTRDFSSRPSARPRAGAILWVGLGGALFLLSSVNAFREHRQSSRAVQAAAEVRDDLAQIRRQTSSRQAARSGADDTLASQIFLSGEAPPAAVLSALEKTLPADVKLSGLTFKYGRMLEIEMQVVARRAEAYDEFLTRLSRAASFRDVSPGMESRQGAVQATVRATFGGTL